MATLTLTEFGSTGYAVKSYPSNFPAGGNILAEQTLALTSSSQQFSALQSGTTLVELSCDTVCYLAFGANPTAVVNYHLMPANTTRIYVVNAPTLIAALT